MKNWGCEWSPAGFSEVQNGVLDVGVSGLVTLEVVRNLRAALALRTDRSRVVCIDFSRALIAVTDAGLGRLYEEANPGENESVMAWVVPDAATAAIWQRQADRFAARGLRRFVARHQAQAQAWCQTQVRLDAPR